MYSLNNLFYEKVYCHFMVCVCRDVTEGERLKLAQQAQTVSVELEQVREQLALKSKDNLKVRTFSFLLFFFSKSIFSLKVNDYKASTGIVIFFFLFLSYFTDNNCH